MKHVLWKVAEFVWYAYCVFCVVLLFYSCTVGHASITKPDAYFTLDSCEYVGFRANGAYAFTHKGDCRNKIHACGCVDTTKKTMDSR